MCRTRSHPSCRRPLSHIPFFSPAKKPFAISPLNLLRRIRILSFHAPFSDVLFSYGRSIPLSQLLGERPRSPFFPPNLYIRIVVFPLQLTFFFLSGFFRDNRAPSASNFYEWDKFIKTPFGYRETPVPFPSLLRFLPTRILLSRNSLLPDKRVTSGIIFDRVTFLFLFSPPPYWPSPIVFKCFTLPPTPLSWGINVIPPPDVVSF